MGWRGDTGTSTRPHPTHPPTRRRSTLWRYLFGRQARDLEQSNSAEDEYMISDTDLFVTKYVSVPREMGHLNPAAFVAGVVRGALDGAGFPARWAERVVGWWPLRRRGSLASGRGAEGCEPASGDCARGDMASLRMQAVVSCQDARRHSAGQACTGSIPA